ncbi:hypothetical protein C8R44DRAFT_877664 [Mycena epipterygia]|nr:hypothetical protein C8R44DRAFT_877664 [Mycena epipterygia]
MDASSDIFDVELERAASPTSSARTISRAWSTTLAKHFIQLYPSSSPKKLASRALKPRIWHIVRFGHYPKYSPQAQLSPSLLGSRRRLFREAEMQGTDTKVYFGDYPLFLGRQQQHHLRGPAQGPRGEYSILSNRPRGPWLNRLSRVPELQRQRTKGHPRNSRSPDPPPQALVQNSATCPDPEPPPPTLSPCAAPPALDASHDAQYALSFASDTDPKPSVVFNVAKYVSEHETLFHSDIVIRYYPRTPRGIPLLVALRSYRPRLADQYSCLASSLQGLACWMVFSIGRDYRRIQVPYYLNECLIRHRDHRLDSQLESGLDWTSYLKSVQTRLGLSFQLCCCILQFGRVSTSFHSIADESIHLVKLE